MKAHCFKACSSPKGMIILRHHHIGERHASISEMEKHLVDDAKRVFAGTDRQGIHSPMDRHHFGLKIKI